MAGDPNGDSAFWQKVQKQELPHCGECDPYSRLIERDDGRVARCPRCHPLQDAMLPQHWRCGACHAIIPRSERGLPCSLHRTVTAWRSAYDEALAGQEQLVLANPSTETGAKSARAQLGEHERQAAEPDPVPETTVAEEEPAEDDYPF